MDKIIAVSLVSGGLDSCLSTKIVLSQAIDVVAVNFTCPVMCKKYSPEAVNKIMQRIGTETIGIDITEDFLEIIKKPKFGYGSNVNPCIDCKILMLKKAKKIMQERGGSFLVTGEVIGQRPMSQMRHTLKLIEKESGLEGLILRPLSAKLLPETIPEIKGWVSRNKLFSMSGRGRKEQIALAQELNLQDYPQPGGGCLLTDPCFSQRIRDLMKYSEISLEEIQWLKIGRHFRLTENSKLIVGRDEAENELMLKLAKGTDIIFEPLEVAGPIAIGRGEDFTNGLKDLAGSIIARYCDKINNDDKIIIKLMNNSSKEMLELSCSPLEEARLAQLRI